LFNREWHILAPGYVVLWTSDVLAPYPSSLLQPEHVLSDSPPWNRAVFRYCLRCSYVYGSFSFVLLSSAIADGQHPASAWLLRHAALSVGPLPLLCALPGSAPTRFRTYRLASRLAAACTTAWLRVLRRRWAGNGTGGAGAARTATRAMAAGARARPAAMRLLAAGRAAVGGAAGGGIAPLREAPAAAATAVAIAIAIMWRVPDRLGLSSPLCTGARQTQQVLLSLTCLFTCGTP